MPQYDYTLDAMINGQVLSAQSVERTLTNPILAQISTATVGGTTDGVYTLQVVGPQGTWSWSYTASSNTAAQIATAIEAAADADTTFRGIGTVEDSTADVVITFDDAYSVYEVTWAAAAAASTVATTQAQGGTVIPYGVFVASTSEGVGVQALAATAANVAGIAVRGTFDSVSNGSTTPAEGIQPGQTFRCIAKGIVCVKVGDAVTPGAVDFKGANATTLIPAGMPGSASLTDGTAVPNGAARFISSAAAQGLAKLDLNLP